MTGANQKKELALQFTTIAVIISCLSVIHVTFLLQTNFKKVLGFWGENLQMTAYLEPNLSQSQRDEIKTKLTKINHIQSLEYVSQEKAVADFSKYVSTMASEFLSKDKELLNFVPASYVMNLDPQINLENEVTNIQNIAENVKKVEGVSEVFFGYDFVSKFSEIGHSLSAALYFLSLIMIIAAVFVFSNAIRANVYHKEEEIQILELVGATTWDIRKPHILKSGGIGFFCSVTALVLNYSIFELLHSKLQSYQALAQIASQLEFTGWINSVGFLFLGSSLGVVASFLCVRAINTGWASVRGVHG